MKTPAKWFQCAIYRYNECQASAEAATPLEAFSDATDCDAPLTYRQCQAAAKALRSPAIRRLPVGAQRLIVLEPEILFLFITGEIDYRPEASE
jgi:hypothetical protein